jgi:bacteriorhodopsin
MGPEQVIQWFTNLPVIFQLTLVGLALAGVQQARQGYIGRVTIAGMAILILQQAYPVWDTLPQIWKYYTFGAVGFGGIGAVSYLSKTSLPTEYYKIALLLYGAVPVGIILWFGFP